MTHGGNTGETDTASQQAPLSEDSFFTRSCPYAVQKLYKNILTYKSYFVKCEFKVIGYSIEMYFSGCSLSSQQKQPQNFFEMGKNIIE